MKRRAVAATVVLTLLVGAAGATRGAAARATDGEVRITIHYSRFEPAEIAVEPGETVRFVIVNTDPIDHEFILGDAEVQRIHEEGTEAHHSPRPGEVSVPAGETVVTTYTFPEIRDSLIFGCHLPGHYDFGMRGTVAVG
ncbi:MAG TPA: cupredoxin domain-containing protein [Actinomycetota bacterium]|nr:cupredoxin domain-containing protein [Actinomycetota bacterium]